MGTSVSVLMGPAALLKHANIYPHRGLVTREARNGHASQGHLTTVLDGDTIRAKSESDLDFTTKSRKEGLRRADEATSLFANAGHTVITMFVSSHRTQQF